MDTATEVVVTVLTALVGGLFRILWSRIDATHQESIQTAKDHAASDDKEHADVWATITSLRNNIAAVTKDLADHRTECAKEYARNSEINRMEERIEARFDRLETLIREGK